MKKIFKVLFIIIFISSIPILNSVRSLYLCSNKKIHLININKTKIKKISRSYEKLL